MFSLEKRLESWYSLKLCSKTNTYAHKNIMHLHVKTWFTCLSTTSQIHWYFYSFSAFCYWCTYVCVNKKIGTWYVFRWYFCQSWEMFSVSLTHSGLEKWHSVIDISWYIFVNENFSNSNKIALKYISVHLIDDNSTFVQVMALRLTWDKPLPGPMFSKMSDAICHHWAPIS